MKRTTLYQVSKDGHVSPVFARSEAPRTRRVWRSWVRKGWEFILCAVGVAVVVLLPGLCEWLAEVVTR